MAKKVLSTKKRTVNTYAYMWSTSYYLLKQGQENPNGSFYQFMASIVFTTFTLEAYLNHIGDKIFNYWNELESLRPQTKLRLLTEYLEIDTNYGIRPWQVMTNLFRFRNEIAHGKSKIVKDETTLPINNCAYNQGPPMVKTEWERYCTRENAEKVREDVNSIIIAIYNAAQNAGFENEKLFDRGFQSRITTVIEE